MKRIFKYLMMMVIASATMFYSCETMELEDLASPNSLSPDLADAFCLTFAYQSFGGSFNKPLEYNNMGIV